jgi:hypothetical protein
MTDSNLIEIPLLENLPVIDKVFAYADIGEEELDMETWPGMIGDDLAEVLQWPVISKLLAFLQPTIRNVVVKSLEELALCAKTNKTQFIEDAEDESVEGYTDDHIQAFLLKHAIYPRRCDWRGMACLFNESSPEEQKQIDCFFWEFHRCMFEDLLKHKGLDLPVPAVLLANNETRQDGDEMFIHCKLADAWLRDDVFSRQFHVSTTEAVTNSITDIGYAGTLEQAIAKAILYAMDKGTSFEQKVNALGNVIAVGGRPRSVTLRLDRVIIASAEKKSVGESGERRLLWGACTSDRITDKQFRKALYATEKLLGVQWNKGRDLEEALGL